MHTGRFIQATFLTAVAIAGMVLVASTGNGAAPSSGFRFAIIGDRTGEAQPGIYEQVWREVDAWHPDLVINVGDTIQGLNDASAEREWRALAPLFAKYRRYPLYFTPGNHDIWSDASRRIYERETKRPAHYSFDFRDAHFTVLDNSQSDSLSTSEIEYLAADLEKARHRPLKFVFFHRPSWLVPVMLGASFELGRLAAQYHVQYVVSGHAHRFARFEVGGTTYLMVGSSGGHLRGSRFEDGWFFHHVRVTVANGKIETVVKEVDPPLGQGRGFTGQEWGSGPVMKAR